MSGAGATAADLLRSRYLMLRAQGYAVRVTRYTVEPVGKPGKVKP